VQVEQSKLMLKMIRKEEKHSIRARRGAVEWYKA
jgi:hypothetical protein